MKGIVQDVCDVVFKRKSDGLVIFTAEAQLAGIDQTIKEDKVKGGIGNRTISVLRSEKEQKLKVKNAIWDTKWLEMSNGVVMSSKSNVVYKKETGLVSDGTGVTIEGTPMVDGDIQVIANDGTMVEGTFAVDKITATGLVNGDRYTALYEIEVTADTLEMKSDVFSENYEVQYSTIQYDPITNVVQADIYWVFDTVTPSDNWSMQFQSGQVIAPELDFTVLTPVGSNVIGKLIEVPRT